LAAHALRRIGRPAKRQVRGDRHIGAILCAPIGGAIDAPRGQETAPVFVSDDHHHRADREPRISARKIDQARAAVRPNPGSFATINGGFDKTAP
jgi:hypothetical protein